MSNLTKVVREKLSIVIPLYNKEETVARAIESVLQQGESAFTLYVIDDGSTDRSCEVVEQFCDARIVLLKQPNQGVSVARNRGVEAAGSGLVAFLDADDFWDDRILEELLKLRAKYPEAGLCSVGYRQVRPDGKYSTLSIDPGKGCNDIQVYNYMSRSRFGNFVHSSSVMIPYDVLQQVGGFPVGEKFGEDVLVWAKIGMHFPVAASRKVLGNFMLDPAGDAPRHQGQIFKHPLISYLAQICGNNLLDEYLRSNAELLLRHKLFQIISYQCNSRNQAAVFDIIYQKELHEYTNIWRMVCFLRYGALKRVFLLCKAIELCKRIRQRLSKFGVMKCGVIQTPIIGEL